MLSDSRRLVWLELFLSLKSIKGQQHLAAIKQCMIITLKNGELSYKQHVLVLNYTNSERHCVDKYTTTFFFSRFKVGGAICQEGGAVRCKRTIFCCVHFKLLLNSDGQKLTPDNTKFSRSIFHITFKIYERLAQTFHECRSLKILVNWNKHACHVSLATHDEQAENKSLEVFQHRLLLF